MMDNTSQSPQLVAGRYRVDRLIARGGMGSVYLCHDLELPRPVAVKVLRPGADVEGSGRFVDRFHLEAKTLASLNHNNIVTLYDYGQTDDGQFYLALEYIEGPRFTDVVRQGPLTAERASDLILQVCRALRYAHKRGVVHRDLKPSNLLIRVDDDGEEQVKVVDFGLVKVLEGDDQSLTRAGLILGSPHCMAPEQIRGQDVDHRTDIYALGVLLFRAVVGQWPFHGDSSTATMIAHVSQPIPAFASMNVDLVVPEGFEAIVVRCLQKRPADRYPDVPALMADLRAIIGRQQTVTISGPSTGSELSIVTGNRTGELSALSQLSEATRALHDMSQAVPTVPLPPAKSASRSPLVAAGVGAGIALALMLLCSGVFVLGGMMGRQYGGGPPVQEASQLQPAPSPTPSPTPSVRPATPDAPPEPAEVPAVVPDTTAAPPATPDPPKSAPPPAKKPVPAAKSEPAAKPAPSTKTEPKAEPKGTSAPPASKEPAKPDSPYKGLDEWDD